MMKLPSAFIATDRCYWQPNLRCRGQSYYRGIAEDGLADSRVQRAFDNRSTFLLFAIRLNHISCSAA